MSELSYVDAWTILKGFSVHTDEHFKRIKEPIGGKYYFVFNVDENQKSNKKN